MGRYMISDNPQVDEVIADIIIEIVSRFHPKSIIMAGGFGRGEASVIEEDGKLIFLSDCEFTTVSGKHSSNNAINRLTTALHRKTGLEIVLHNSLRLQVFASFPWVSKVSVKLWRPSIQHYDLKHGTQVVFGENTLGTVPNMEPEDIPLWEGIKLMFNRMAGALKFSPVDGRERDESIYWTNKVILACQDALLLSVGQYHYSYRKRNIMLQELFTTHFSELNQRLPNFLPLAIKATDYKLRPAKDAYSQEIMELWFDAVAICDEVFRYIIKRDMDITFDNYVEFQERYLKHPNVRGKYYVGIVSIPILHNATAALRMIANDSYRFPPPKLIASLMTPWQHIAYSLLPLVYFGLSREGKVNELQLKQVRDTISLFKRLEPQNHEPIEEWRYIKAQAVELWHTLC